MNHSNSFAYPQGILSDLSLGSFRELVSPFASAYRVGTAEPAFPGMSVIGVDCSWRKPVYT